MQGSVAKPHLEKFVGKLREGQAYYLHYLGIKEARDSYRAVDNCFEARLTKWTEVTEINPVPDSLPRYAYKIRSFQSLLATASDRTYLAGIISAIFALFLHSHCFLCMFINWVFHLLFLCRHSGHSYWDFGCGGY